MLVCSKYILSLLFTALFISGYCHEDKNYGTITFKIKPVFNNEPLILSTKTYVSPSNDTLQIDRFKFYLSSFEIVFSDSTVFKEENSYHLIDAEEDTTLIFKIKNVPEGKIISIRFSVGVDSVKSVSGAFGGDLDPMHGMYWAWNSGYIHAKLEGRSKSCKTHQNGFEYHIGGFSHPENAIRQVELKISTKKPKQDVDDFIILSADAGLWLKNISLGSEPSVVIPGKKAMAIADNYQQMFNVVYED